MNFKQALKKSLKADKHTHTDSFLLHAHISDLVGNDYEAKKAAEEFYRLDAKYEISKTILAAAPQKPREKRVYRIKPMPQPPENAQVFYDTATETVHLLETCPRLSDPIAVHLVTYAKARRMDVCRTHPEIPWWSPRLNRMAKTHTPRICRRCGEFISKGVYYTG